MAKIELKKIVSTYIPRPFGTREWHTAHVIWPAGLRMTDKRLWDIEFYLLPLADVWCRFIIFDMEKDGSYGACTDICECSPSYMLRLWNPELVKRHTNCHVRLEFKPMNYDRGMR